MKPLTLGFLLLLAGCATSPTNPGKPAPLLPLDPTAANFAMNGILYADHLTSCVQLPSPPDVIAACAPVPVTVDQNTAGIALQGCINAAALGRAYDATRKLQFTQCPIIVPVPKPGG